jgi:hypothetical protein
MRGQSILEYIFLIGIATIVLMFMGTDIKRGLESVVKTTADQMGSQANAEQDFSRGGSFLTGSITNATQEHKQMTKEYVGNITTEVNDRAEVLTTTTTNASFTPR